MRAATHVFSGPSVIANAFWQNRVLWSLALAHLIVAYLTSLLLGVPFQSATVPTLLMVLKTLVPCFLIFLMLWRFGWMILHVRPARPTRWFIEDARRVLLDPDRIATGTIAFLGICVFAGSFTVLKDLIPLIVPFSWDVYFADLDRTLHGGVDPYLLLMPVLGTPWMTTIINAAYHFWFFLLYFIVFMTAFDKLQPLRRNTFLIAFVLTWAIGGNLLAIVFSSAGPVYYQAMGFGDTFVPLVETLKDFAQVSPVWALDVHQMLLDGYRGDGLVKGISAMPSMHVASAVLLALFGFQYRKWAGWTLVVFAIIIQLGSVHLAWHYAIDGYLGAIVAIICWLSAQKLAKKFG